MTRTIRTLLLAATMLLLLAMGRRMPDLMEQAIVYWTPGEPAGCDYSAQVDQGEGWKLVALKQGVIVSGDCLGHSDMNATFRACCGESDESCIEAGPDPEPVQCNTIYDLLTGRMYGPREVEAWNAAHQGG